MPLTPKAPLLDRSHSTPLQCLKGQDLAKLSGLACGKEEGRSLDQGQKAATTTTIPILVIWL